VSGPIRFRCLYGESRGSPAKHKKEKAGKPPTSPKALQLVIWESQTVSGLQIGAAWDSITRSRGIVYQSDMPCMSKEKKSIHPNLCLFLWIRRTSGHSWGPKHLEQSGASKHHSLAGVNEADVSTDCVSKK